MRSVSVRFVDVKHMHEGKTTGLTVYKTVFVTNQSDVLWRKTGLEKNISIHVCVKNNVITLRSRNQSMYMYFVEI